MDKKKLGQALLKTKKLSKEQLKNAMAMHDKIGGDFAPLLVKLGYVSDQDITNIVAKLEGIETVEITDLIIPKKLVQSIPRDVIEKHNVMPISRKGDQITLAMCKVNDYEAIEEIQFLTGCRVDPVLASRDAIRKSIIQFYYGDDDGEQQRNIEDAEPSVKGIEDLLKAADFAVLQKALLALVVEKNIISKEEILHKVKEIS